METFELHKVCDDVAKVCRLCMEALNLNFTMEDRTTLSMVEECLQQTFTFKPPFLSAEICDDCYYKIKDFYEFKENCRSIQDLLWKDIENYEASLRSAEKQQLLSVNGSEQPDDDDSIEMQETIVDDGQVVDAPPVILNSSLVAANRSGSTAENATECATIGKVECINVSLYSGRDNVIIVNQRVYHKCSLCNKSYSNATRLQQHLLAHKKKRTYLCEYCSMSFRQNSSLQVHIRSHTKEKPFVCSHCGNAYGYYHLLKKHVNRYHAPESGDSWIAAGQQVV